MKQFSLMTMISMTTVHWNCESSYFVLNIMFTMKMYLLHSKWRIWWVHFHLKHLHLERENWFQNLNDNDDIKDDFFQRWKSQENFWLSIAGESFEEIHEKFSKKASGRISKGINQVLTRREYIYFFFKESLEIFLRILQRNFWEFR